MACVTHLCLDCDGIYFGNDPCCPKCGSIECTSYFDEPPEVEVEVRDIRDGIYEDLRVKGTR